MRDTYSYEGELTKLFFTIFPSTELTGPFSSFDPLQLLLSLARGLFTEQRNLQRLIFKIISEAKDLLR